MKTIETKNAPAAIGPYSQAKIVGNLVYCSGQLPVDPATSQIEGKTVSEQTHQSCKNVAALLLAAGTSIDKVVKTTCFLANIALYSKNKFFHGRGYAVVVVRKSYIVRRSQHGVA